MTGLCELDLCGYAEHALCGVYEEDGYEAVGRWVWEMGKTGQKRTDMKEILSAYAILAIMKDSDKKRKSFFRTV